MEGHVYSIVHRPVGSVGELHGVQERVRDGFEVRQDKALKGFHDHRGQGDWSVVFEFFGPCFFGDGDDGGGFKTGWYMACLQRGVKNVCKYWRQLICTVLEGGGGDRVRSSCLAGFLPLEESVTFSWMTPP